MFGFDMFRVGLGPYRAQLRCFSVSMASDGGEREHLEQGGKILLPPSSLDALTRLHIVYPMLFKLTNPSSARTTHCGVLEFVADEGKAHIPYWMMQNLGLQEGDLMQVESTSLPVATFAKFQPHSSDFLELVNPKAVLESRLRNFACLSKGDTLAIHYNDRTYALSVLETRPEDAVSVIECDLNVDFAPPIGYVEKGREEQKEDHDDEADHMDVSELVGEPEGFVPFSGTGMRLDGKRNKNKEKDSDAPKPKIEYKRGIPDFEWSFGNINFLRRTRRPKNDAGNNDDENSNDFEAFKGTGHTLS